MLDSIREDNVGRTTSYGSNKFTINFEHLVRQVDT